MTQVASELIKTVESLQERRYPTVVVIQNDSVPITGAEIKIVAENCSLRHVNYREEILARPDCNIVLGAYLRGHFLEWLLKLAHQSGGLLVENADEVIAFWPDAERKAFFLEFLRTECNDQENPARRIPIVLLSRYAARFLLPTEETGQGVVFNPITCEESSSNGHS